MYKWVKFCKYILAHCMEYLHYGNYFLILIGRGMIAIWDMPQFSLSGTLLDS